MDLFSPDVRRDPCASYDFIRKTSPLLRPPPFAYDGVKRALTDNDTFSSRVPAPRNRFLFFDPPEHTKLRGLISKASTPAVVARLGPRPRELSRELLDQAATRGEMDLAADYAIPLPMKVISEMIGIPPSDWTRFRRWSDAILKLSYARSGGPEAEAGRREFSVATAEMNEYLTEMIAERHAEPRQDLLTRLIEAEIDGERLTQDEILGFFQLLIVGGQERRRI